MCGAFMDGGGIVINAFNRGWAPLSRLCDKLQAIFYAAVMNLYLTPKKVAHKCCSGTPAGGSHTILECRRRRRSRPTPIPRTSSSCRCDLS